MQTKQKELSSSQRDMEKKKKRAMWWMIGVLFGLEIIVYIMHPTVLTFTIFTLGWIIFCYREQAEKLNMSISAKKLQKKVDEEKEHISILKKHYTIISLHPFNEMHSEVKKTAIYLLSDPKKNPTK